MKQSRKGYFITFEGTEGSGKSTQIQSATKFLKKMGCKVLLLREPGGTRVGEAVRKVLLDKKLMEMCPETELLLYLAARAQIIREKIIPALAKGWVVICDRFEDSTVAYQGYGRKLSLKAIEAMSEFTRGEFLPDRTFLLDIDPKIGMKRGGRHDRMEKQSLQFHGRVRKGFLTIAKKNRQRFVVLDSTKSIEAVRTAIEGVIHHDLGCCS